MNPLSLLSPVPRSSADTGEFTCKAERPWCTWNGLHGGALMGMLISSLEQLAGKPLVSATAQFVKGVKEGDEIVVAGNYQLMLATSGTAAKGGHFHSDGTFHEGKD